MKTDFSKSEEINIIEIILNGQKAKEKLNKIYLEPLKEFLKNIYDDLTGDELAKRVIESALQSCYYRPFFSSFDVWILTWLQDHLLGQKISKNEFFLIFERIELKDEKKLLEAYLKGEDATGELYRRYSKFVISKILNTGIALKEAEDLVQEIFQKAFSKLYMLEKPEAFRNWIGKISQNYALRHRNHGHEISLHDLDETELNVNEEICNGLLKNEEIEILKKGLNRLPKKYKTAIFMKYFKDMSYKEIAETINIDIKSAYKRVFQGIEKLREMLMTRRD